MTAPTSSTPAGPAAAAGPPVPTDAAGPQAVALLLIAAVVVTAGLFYLEAVLVPFVLALFVAALINPLVDALQVKTRLPRALALLAGFGVLLIGLAVVGGLMTVSFQGFDAKAAIYQQRLAEFGGQLSVWLDGLGFDVGQHSLADGLAKLPVLDIANQALGTTVTLVSNSALILIFVAYLVGGHKPGRVSTGVWAEIDESVRRYVGVKLWTSAVTAVLVALVLWAFGVDLAFVFGVLTFLLNFIPNIGSVLATLLPLPIVLVQFGAGGTALAVIVLVLLVQQVVGNVLEPRMMGEGLDLHPVTVLLALAFWGIVWGLGGMLLSAPLTAIVRIIFARHALTRPVAELLAGRVAGHGEPDQGTAAISPAP